MTTKKTRRRFTPEYKDQAVARLSEVGVTCTSLAAELEVTSGQRKSWHLELLAAASVAALAQSKAEAAELAQLRRDNKRLKEENEVMRKAPAFFAQWTAKTLLQSSLSLLPTLPAILSDCSAASLASAGAGSMPGSARTRNGRDTMPDMRP